MEDIRMRARPAQSKNWPGPKEPGLLIPPSPITAQTPLAPFRRVGSGENPVSWFQPIAGRDVVALSSAYSWPRSF